MALTLNQRVGGVALCVFLSASLASADAVDVAARQLGKYYAWGGDGPNAFDCSGLTKYSFGRVGISLPRTAAEQSTDGRKVRGPLRRGDLLFFSTDRRRPGVVTHVGIYEARGRMINASSRHGRVKREDIGDEYWASRLLFAKRMPEFALAQRELPGPVDDEPPMSRRREGRPRSRGTLARAAERAAEVAGYVRAGQQWVVIVPEARKRNRARFLLERGAQAWLPGR